MPPPPGLRRETYVTPIKLPAKTVLWTGIAPQKHLAHQIRAMGPSPACWTTLETEDGTIERVKILEAHPIQAHEQNNRENGEALRALHGQTDMLEAEAGHVLLRPEGLVVRCGDPVSDDGAAASRAAEASNAPIPGKESAHDPYEQASLRKARRLTRPPGGYDSLCVTRIQRAGRRPMAPAEFFRGFPSPPRRFVQPQVPASRGPSGPGGVREKAPETTAGAARRAGSPAFRQTRQKTGATSRVRAVEAYGSGT